MTSFRSEAEEAPRRVQTQTLEWRGITIAASYDPDWLGMSQKENDLGYGYAHLEMRVLHPEGAAIPVTDTGYRSHFLSRGMVEDAGGIEAYVTAWLDDAAMDRQWLLSEEKRRQGDLFA